MAYTVKELEQLVQDKINASRRPTWSAQNDVSYWRGLHHKKDTQLLEAVKFYENQYKELIEKYKESLREMDDLIRGIGISVVDHKTETKELINSISRLADKHWAVRNEIEGRQKGFFKRKPIGTTYYIDLINGNDYNNGLSPSSAWKTIEKYTTVTVRSPGDTAFVRANTIEIPAGNIVHDEAGNSNNLISIVGCSKQDDPWGDQSDVKPIIDFNNTTAHYWLIQFLPFWKLKRLDIRNGCYSYGMFQCNYSRWISFDSCEFSGGVKGLYFSYTDWIFIDNCIFKGNSSYGINTFSNCFALIKNSIFDGEGRQGIGLLIECGGVVECINCSFGQTIPHNFADARVYNGSRIYFYNCKYNKIDSGDASLPAKSAIFCKDDNKVYGAGKIIGPMNRGKIIKDSSIKTGNADFSFKFEPGSLLGKYYPLLINEYSFGHTPFMINLPAGSQRKLTVKLYAESAWTVWPTADELYLEASYYSSPTTADRATIRSTQVLSAAQTWTDFSVTFTPQRDGVVYLNVFLCKYEAGKSIHVNGEVEVS